MMIDSVYNVQRLQRHIDIDGNWNKEEWTTVPGIAIRHFMGCIPQFRPKTQVKLLYDDHNLYVIYRVHDAYVRCMELNWNGPVSNDSCVEFFFSPDSNQPERYFNLEVNCGGTPLMRYNIIPRKEFTTLEPRQLREIEIAHSLPSRVDPEITEPVTWTVECRVPFSLLKTFSNLTYPRPGLNWRANFYKTAGEGSNPHWITWNLVNSANPDFHLPQFFGNLQFN